MIHNCSYCNYESHHKWVVRRHMEIKHQNQNIQNNQLQQPLGPQLKTSYMQSNSHQNPLVTQNQYLQNKVNELQGGNKFQNTFLRNQAMQTEQTFPFRKRSRLDNDDKSNEYPHDVAYKLEDIITDIHIKFKNLVKLRKQFLKALEKYEGRDKKDILKKYMKLKPWLFSPCATRGSVIKTA